MYKYKNEAKFSNALVAHLRKHGWFVQRIETGSIGRGVPDIYAVTPTGTPVWLELKRVHTSLRGKDRVKIPWRPGQQAWLTTITKYKQAAYTLAAFDDCILQIPHSSYWSDDTVLFSKCKIHFSLATI